jgi:hypothetical protein
MSETRFTWGDSVRVIETDGVPLDWRPASAGSICGFRKIGTEQESASSSFAIGTVVYTVEFEDGKSAQVPEDGLEPIECRGGGVD